MNDLGKIQIPKELRRLLRIGVGDLMEFFTVDNHIVLVPYMEIAAETKNREIHAAP